MTNIKLVKVIYLDKNKELPVQVNDNFQEKNADGSPVIAEFAPVAEVSQQLADKLIKTYPKVYAVFDPSVHTDSKEGYKIAQNYRKPLFENIFNQLSPDQRDEVLAFMHRVKNGELVSKDDGVTIEPAKATLFEELKAKLQASKETQE